MKHLLVVEALLLLAAQGVAWAQFRDDFDGPALDPRWEWRVPVPGPSLSLDANPGWLRLTVPQREEGYNHWTGEHGMDAPLLLARVPEGDWVAETHLRLAEWAPDSNFHFALCVEFSPGCLLSWGPFYLPLLYQQQQPEVWCEPTGFGGYHVVPGEAAEVFLRIEKAGDSYRMLVQREAEGDWTEECTFRGLFAPRAISILGKTAGAGPQTAVDVDYIELAARPAAPAEELRATVRVDPNAEGWPLDRRRFGHFIEHLGRCIYGGIWAELLHNRKFTGAAGDRGVVEGWEPRGEPDAVAFDRENRDYWAPAQAQRVTIQDEAEGGVAQVGIEVRGDVGLAGRLVHQARGVAALRVRLLEGEAELASVPLQPSAEWSTQEFAFPALGHNGRVTFELLARGQGTLLLGACSLMPADNVEGMRRDVLEAIREVHPPVVRWPGGNFVSGYHWQDGLGPQDQRPPRWDRAWAAWEWNDFGTHEFLRFCELVGAEPYICVNAGEGTAAEAAAWVEYCNGAADSLLIRRRAANGHPEPFGVKLWGIGNEMYGGWQLGNLDATRYALKSVEFARALRGVQPDLDLVLVGVDRDGWGDWNRIVSRVAGPEAQYLSVHYYLGVNNDEDHSTNYARVLAAAADVEGMLRDTADLVDAAAGGPGRLPLCFDEWNVWSTESHGGTAYESFYSLRDGLFAAGVFNGLQRLGPRVPIANLAQLVNVLGALRTSNTAVVRTPLHRVFQLYTEHSGEVGLPAEVATPGLPFPGHPALPAVDVSVTTSADRRTLYVALVNRHPAQSATVVLDLAGLALPADGTLTLVHAADFEARNTFETPDAVQLTTQAVDPQNGISLPAHCAAVLEVGVR